MPENLPDHTHCLECDSAIPTGRQFCSDGCEVAFRAKARKERNRNILFMAAAMAIIIILALASALF